ncbi:hypothetical protein K469DRAFT_28177 [Zopfia rhizophila CBS 207.26]|uniref:Transposase IS30-like HTH domain-containing protein n=1 Tax=Zopfia rhizophila CBS 207.26 TaxID=1314779 RepID=A0A6A6DDJ7_9PEZI|nr:hypothetical protein K469DRAFT_28177 [Zopfia rhizophila CBS 207.26]
MPGKHKNRQSFRDPVRPRGQRLSEYERTQVLTLYNTAGWNKTVIARELGLAHSTVRLCISEGYFTPKRPPGRRPILTTGKRRRLIHRATLDAYHRRLSYDEIAQLEGLNLCRRSLLKAFERE